MVGSVILGVETLQDAESSRGRTSIQGRELQGK